VLVINLPAYLGCCRGTMRRFQCPALYATPRHPATDAAGFRFFSLFGNRAVPFNGLTRSSCPRKARNQRDADYPSPVEACGAPSTALDARCCPPGMRFLRRLG